MTWLVRLADVPGVTVVDAPRRVRRRRHTRRGHCHRAAALRLVRGHADGTFRASELVRRDQAGSLSRLVRALVHRWLLQDRPIPPFAAPRAPLPGEMRRQMTGST
ncbi:MAG TPA: hypothetical protein VK923_00945 [Euzebyales bacterium]|nr:hypothetical protein [Euzebyales bacterium]